MIKSAKLLIAALMAIALFSFSHAALAADSWGLPGEEEVRFDAKVIDVLCVLSGDCPPDCGAGKRLLGLLKEDGELVLPIKTAARSPAPWPTCCRIAARWSPPTACLPSITASRPSPFSFCAGGGEMAAHQRFRQTMGGDARARGQGQGGAALVPQRRNNFGDHRRAG